MERPRLRPLEAFPVDHEGQQMVALRDPAHLTDAVMLLSPIAMAAAGLMDGRRLLPEVLDEMRRRVGVAPPLQDLEGLVRRLDACHFLDSDAFRSHFDGLVQGFRELPARPPFLAGRSYPDDPAELGDHLGGLLAGLSPTNGRRLVGLYAPHIDLERGAQVYGRTYVELQDAEPADLYVLFGTSHAPTRQPFALTRKGYETPLGTVETAADLVDRLASRVGGQYFEDEFNHRSEHSLEFQALFLRKVLGNAPFRALPILCGLTPELMRPGRTPGDLPDARRFLEGLKEVLAESGLRVRFIGGVDLAHVGERFGDRGRLTPEFLSWVEAEDRRSLGHVLEGDAEGFWRSVTDDGDRRRICGLAPIYAMLSVMPPAPARLLDYRQCVDPEGTCCVSIAGVAVG